MTIADIFSTFHAYRRGEVTALGVVSGAIKARADRNGTVLSRLPLSTFFEHMTVYGTTGAGKSNIYEILVKRFAGDALDQKMSMVIVDGSIFPDRVVRYVDRSLRKINSPRLFLFDPQPGKGRSMDHLIEANIFDLPDEIRDQTSPEFITNLYLDVCQQLFDFPLTDLMKTLLQYTTDLMEDVGKPSLVTVREILDDPEPFLRRCEDQDIVTFFRNDVLRKGATYSRTRDQIKSRLDSVLRSKTMRKMFCSPEPKMNIYREVLEGGLFIFATRAGPGSEELARTIGRLGLMVAGQISAMKASVDGVNSLLLCDEAHEYAIKGDIASIRRSYKMDRKNGDGRALALQQPGDFCQAMFDTIMNCSAAKCFGRTENEADAKKLAGNIGVTAADLQGLKSGEFFIKVRGLHDKGIKVSIPPGALGKWKNEAEKRRMQREARDSVITLRKITARRYGSVSKRNVRNIRRAA